MPVPALGDTRAQLPPAASGSAVILAALARLGGMQAAVAAGTLVRNKALASWLRPEGFGEFMQLVAVASVFHVVVQSGMAVGLARNAAAARTPEARQRQLRVANFMTTALGFFSLAILLPLLFSPAADRVLPVLGIVPGGSQKLMLAFLLALAPLEALRNNLMVFLQGVLDIEGLSSRRSLAVAAAAVLAFPLIALWGMTGACLHTAFAALFMAVLLGRRCSQTGYRPFSLHWEPSTARLLASFGGASLLVGFAQNLAESLIRGHLINAWGAGENGLYQSALTLAISASTVVLMSVSAYSLAAFCQAAGAGALQRGMDDLLRVVVPVATLALGLIGLLSRPLLVALYSSHFSAAASYLPLLLPAYYVQAASWAFASAILAAGLIRYWIAIELGTVLLRYLIAIYGAPLFGPLAIPAGLLLAMVFNTAVYARLSRTRCGLVIAPLPAARFCLGAASVSAVALIPSFLPAILLLSLVSASLLWPDRRAIHSCVARYLGKHPAPQAEL